MQLYKLHITVTILEHDIWVYLNAHFGAMATLDLPPEQMISFFI